MGLKKKPLVSVIIPVFNGRQFLHKTLKSVVQQTYSNLEIIVIEDGSDEDSCDIVGSFRDISYLAQRHLGNAEARNKGVRLAQGEYLCFLDQDDLVPKEKIEHQVSFLQTHPDVWLVSGLTQEFCESSQIPSWVREAAKNGPHSGISPGTWLIRKSLFDKVGLFNTTFRSTSDTEWIVRLKKEGYEVPLLPEVVLRKRIHESNQSAHPSAKLVKQYHTELIQIFRKTS